MNLTINDRIQNLTSRNEGKIKSYESCFDIRAWSHDFRVRDRYLREWIKCDMPVCFLPVCTLTNFLKIMTVKSRGKTTPRCHPDCKSKVLLESICASCHAIKECLKGNEKFDKYFEEEEFETSHWPCERCLDALKSIKIFWKIILEKIFHINIGKNHELNIPHDSEVRLDGIKSVTKVWEKDIVEQALFIKNIGPVVKESLSILNTIKDIKNPVKCGTVCDDRCYNLKNTINSESIPKTEKANSKVKRTSNAECNTRHLPNKSFTRKPIRKLSRSILVRVKTADAACSTCNIDKDNEELKAHKENLKYLQEIFNVNKTEIERLQQENLWLKCELQNSRKRYYCQSGFNTPQTLNSADEYATALNSIEVEGQTDNDSAKNIESEMIITMKNCPNKSFRHVSLLQVLHKTNDPTIVSLNTNELAYTKENPINLLNKVQTTFGAIVKREMGILSEKQTRTKRSDIEATFRRVNASRSAPSCSTMSTRSGTHLFSTKTTSDRLE